MFVVGIYGYAISVIYMVRVDAIIKLSMFCNNLAATVDRHLPSSK